MAQDDRNPRRVSGRLLIFAVGREKEIIYQQKGRSRAYVVGGFLRSFCAQTTRRQLPPVQA